ncbi:outer membrane beta-barrel protein [Shewanella psychropiezotolerans]|uniref:Outer membrane beta-barrel protein n=1 Tax=Shewanella psychropiezotolerans TaxID=2593655 RepID=A0ABX5WXG4_9GAMM|nr:MULTISPECIES: outer membrane beta-barrel protein [Shewanella]MPY26549.1 outer membrane beta-barrel protein [Shewanella sp. YLB-07]QDO83787.1 outer membrane beta-barrel protein [Shewanella psychropiezotolerans]
MKKVLLACALTSIVAISSIATANASEFTINPMIGASHSKAGGVNSAIGLEAGYGDFLFGYTYTGNSNDFSISHSEDELNPVPFADKDYSASVYSNDKFNAHALYVGYQFDMGSGHLAVKAGVELSKFKQKAGMSSSMVIDTDGGIGRDINSVNFTSESNYEYAPMVGVGYYMNNGLNFNLHYTWQNGTRDMKNSAQGTFNGVQDSKKFANSEVANKDFSTVMFTVGYRF